VARSNGRVALCAACTTDMCAERRLLEQVVNEVKGDGRPTTHKVRRALGTISVERVLADGSYGYSAPCFGCCMALAKYDVRVRFWDGTKWCVTRSEDLVGGMVTLADRRRWGRPLSRGRA